MTLNSFKYFICSFYTGVHNIAILKEILNKVHFVNRSFFRLSDSLD